MGSRSAPWKADHCLIRNLPHNEMCALAVRAYYKTGDEEEGSKDAKMAKGEIVLLFWGPVLSCHELFDIINTPSSGSFIRNCTSKHCPLFLKHIA